MTALLSESLTLTHRVFLTLLGHADRTGYVGTRQRDELLDCARVSEGEWERAVGELQVRGKIAVDPVGGRRRWRVLGHPERSEAFAYVNGEQPRVDALRRERDRLTRLRLKGWNDVVIENAAREQTTSEKVRWRFDARLPEVGVLRELCYYEASGMLYGPTRHREGAQLVEPQGHLLSQLLAAIRTYVVSQSARLEQEP